MGRWLVEATEAGDTEEHELGSASLNPLPHGAWAAASGNPACPSASSSREEAAGSLGGGGTGDRRGTTGSHQLADYKSVQSNPKRQKNTLLAP